MATLSFDGTQWTFADGTQWTFADGTQWT